MDRMKVSSLPVSALACLLAFGLAVPRAAASDRPDPQRTLAPESCKPTAPILLTLEELGRNGTQTDLRLTITPKIPLLSLEWELELPEDAVFVRGQRFGHADRREAVTTTRRARIGFPTDGEYRKVRLFARGTFEGSDGAGNPVPEEIVSVQTLTWGTPPPVGPILMTPDDGVMKPHVVLPTQHFAARRPGWKALPRTDVREPGAPSGAAAGGGTFLVTGVFEYEDKDWNYGGWTGSDPILPVREADITVLDDTSSAVLGTGSTGSDGSFSIVCTSVGTTDVVVRVNSDTSNASFQRIRATTTGNSEYTALSPVFASHDTSLDLDVGSTTILKSFAGSDEGNPFNCLDQGIDAWLYITGPDVGAGTTAAVRINWPGGGGSFASGSNATISDDDGYDDAVILHEIGHVVHNLYSDSDSPGGSHTFGDSDQDPRLSLGEGYATFFAGVVFIEVLDKRAAYFDGNGAAQNGGVQLRMRLEDAEPWDNGARGAADEVAVACTLYDILDDELSNDMDGGNDDDPFVSTTLINGDNVHKAWWDVFVGPFASATDVTMNNSWNAWFNEHGVDGLHAEMESLYSAFRIDFFNDADEPNDTEGTATPITVDGVFGDNRTLYSGSGSPPVPGVNDVDWYAVDLVIGSILEVQTRYPNGAGDANTQADCHLRLRSPSGVNINDEDSGTGRNALVTHTIDESGTWLVRVTTNHSYRRYGRYNLRLRYNFENLVPVIASGPTATPAIIGPGQNQTQLSAIATDAQAVTYTWTPLNGGTIIGSGSNVTFKVPNGSNKTFEVQLVVTDSLGAETDPVTVSVPAVPFYKEVPRPEPKK